MPCISSGHSASSMNLPSRLRAAGFAHLVSACTRCGCGACRAGLRSPFRRPGRPQGEPGPPCNGVPAAQGVIPTIIAWNLCRSPPETSSPACGGGRVGARFRASGSGGANAAIRNVRRVQRAGGRSPAKTRHAERPAPSPSRRAYRMHTSRFEVHPVRPLARPCRAPPRFVTLAKAGVHPWLRMPP